MAVDLVLNELSFRMPAQDEWEARKRMTTLMETLNETRSHATNVDLHFHETLYQYPLSPGYFLQQWLEDPDVDRDEKRSFLGYEHRSPLFAYRPELRERQSGLEYHFNGQVAVGLGAADQLGALAISLSSSPEWEFGRLEVELFELPDIDQAEKKEVVHACRRAHVQEHAHWFFERQRDSIHRGKDLWRQKGTLYPRLIFCDNVGDLVEGITTGDPKLKHILIQLRRLDSYCVDAAKWTNGAFDKHKLGTHCRTESTRTIEEYGDRREFLCPDGERRRFDWHVDVPPHEWRLHFYPLPETRHIIIGYIGPHLDIASNPT